MKKKYNIKNISFINDKMVLFIDEKEFEFHLSEISDKLVKANQMEREKVEISPSGYGLHWPLIDEDLSIDGLLGIKHSPKGKKRVTI